MNNRKTIITRTRAIRIHFAEGYGFVPTFPLPLKFRGHLNPSAPIECVVMAISFLKKILCLYI